MRVDACSFVVSSFLVAQTPINASLIANAPLTVSFTTAATTTVTHPAGPLTTSGTLQSSGTFPVSRLSWTAPSSSFVGCELRSSQSPFQVLTCGGSADVTLFVSGPAGTRGHVLIEVNASGDLITPLDVRVDVHDDGTFEANSLGWIAGSFGPSMIREWAVPVVLGATPLAVRLLHAVNTMVLQGYTMKIRFVPWSPRAHDLGSSCGVSEVGWYLGNPWPTNGPYFLSAQLFPGSGKDRLVAHGFGTFGLFVFSERPTRLPIGALGLGAGCDDALRAPLVLIDGANPAPGEWQFEVPPLPTGYELFVQHLSLGAASVGPPLRFGVSNLVRLQY